MDERFKIKASTRSDQELRQIIDNREKYLPESVEAAVEELQSRGTEFSGDELRVINEDMQARRDLARNDVESFNLFRYGTVNNHIEDPDAPELYTKRVIYGFSIFFSALFGSIMLAINVYKTKGAGQAAIVVLFGLGYTIAAIIIGNSIHSNSYSSISIVVGIVGGFLLNALFWNRFIGNETLYRPKPIWIPLIIGLVLAVIIVILMVNSEQV